jgi:hypothetical protein
VFDDDAEYVEIVVGSGNSGALGHVRSDGDHSPVLMGVRLLGTGQDIIASA